MFLVRLNSHILLLRHIAYRTVLELFPEGTSISIAHIRIVNIFTLNVKLSVYSSLFPRVHVEFQLDSASPIAKCTDFGYLHLGETAHHVPGVTLTYRPHTSLHKHIVCTCRNHNERSALPPP